MKPMLACTKVIGASSSHATAGPQLGNHAVASAIDGAFLHIETPETPMHVGSLHLFDIPAGYRGDFHADVRKLIEDSLRRLLERDGFRRQRYGKCCRYECDH